VRSSPTVQPIPSDLSANIARSVEIGKQLYVLDKVAALGTDVLFANEQHPEKQGVVGYLPLREGDDEGRPRDSFLVSFFTGDQPPRIAYDVRIQPDVQPAFQAHSPPREVSAEIAALIGARQAAVAAMPNTHQPVNPVLLPAELMGHSGVLVYLLAGTKQPDVAVFGKHYRAIVALGGTNVSSMTPLSNTALEVPTRAPNGTHAEGLWVTHVVTTYPLETHVFTSLLHKKPVYVSTQRGLWRVEGDEISFLGKVESDPGE
jgi:hypothetical protein